MSLNEDFQLGTTPEITDFNGDFVVKLEVPVLPAIRFLGHNKHFPSGIEIGGGYNPFLGFFKIGKFRIEKGKSELDDELEVLKIIYDSIENPFFIRPLVDELRQISPDCYLGRGIYTIFGRRLKVFYFTVIK
ncbi:MAG: hypothetical protein GY751_09875 [Bacteroidetes bacterium]|nr:hypothetical protein [Bacteroidota bacterium]